MTDDWQNSPRLLAAAFEGMAENPARPVQERLELAMQAIAHLHEALIEVEQQRTNVEASMENLKRANDHLWPIVFGAEDLKAGFDARKPHGGEALSRLLYLVERWQEQGKRLYPASHQAYRTSLVEDVLDAAKGWLNSSAHVSAHFHGCLEGVDSVLAEAVVSYEVAEGDGFDPRA